VVTQEPATPLYEHVESGFARTPRGAQAFTTANSSSSHHCPSPEPKGCQADPSITAMETQSESLKYPVFPGVEESATATGGGNLGDMFREREEKIINVIPEGNKEKDMGVKRGEYIPQIEPDSMGSNNKGKGMEHYVDERVTKRENKVIKDGLTSRILTIANGPIGVKGPSTAPGSIFPPLTTRGSQAVGGFKTTPKQTWKRKARGGHFPTETGAMSQGGKRTSSEREEEVTGGRKKIQVQEGLWLRDTVTNQLELENGGSGLAEAVEQPRQPS
jgi:hypothetical protein